MKLTLHCRFQILKVLSMMIPLYWHFSRFLNLLRVSLHYSITNIKRVIGKCILLAPIVEKYGGKRLLNFLTSLLYNSCTLYFLKDILNLIISLINREFLQEITQTNLCICSCYLADKRMSLKPNFSLIQSIWRH